MEIWGITGVIGSGKSSAIAHLYSKGFPVLDADQASRKVVDKNTPEGKEGFAQIYRAFGPEVLNNLGDLDRGKLRQRMMRNPSDRETLERILHPLIFKYITGQMTNWKASGAKLGFIEGSRLVESGFHNHLAGIIIVTAPEAKRIQRVMKRDSMGKDEVAMMFNLQDELVMKRVAKIEWKNDKSVKDLENIVDAFVEERLVHIK